jgi:hypothetical protein
MNPGTLVLLICAVMIVSGAIIGLARRPQAVARAKALGDAIGLMAQRFGWRFDQSPVPYLATLPRIDGVLGGYGVNTFGTEVNAKLVGEWHGVPITALQITNRDSRFMHVVFQTNTMLLVPRPVPGPDVVLMQQGLSWPHLGRSRQRIGHPAFDSRFHVHAPDDQAARTVVNPATIELLLTDPRIRDRVLFFGPQHLAALFPGVIAQPQVVAATADLLVEVGRRMAQG